MLREMEPCRSRWDHSLPVVDHRHLLGFNRRQGWQAAGGGSDGLLLLTSLQLHAQIFGEMLPMCSVSPTRAFGKETILASVWGEIIPRTLLGTAPSAQMAVLMLEPFPSLHPRRRRGWRQGCAGHAGCQAAPPASILPLLFLASQGRRGLWPLSSSAGHCSLQEELSISTVLSKTVQFKVNLKQLLFFFSSPRIRIPVVVVKADVVGRRTWHCL